MLDTLDALPSPSLGDAGASRADTDTAGVAPAARWGTTATNGSAVSSAETTL